MKVLQINSVCGIRSTGRICTDIADVLKQNGDECLIAYGREDVPEKYRGISLRTDTEIGTKLHALQSRIFDNAGFARRKATAKFIDSMQSFDPDIIHLHNIHGYFINIEELFQYLKTAGKPVIWTLHDCWAFTGHCTYPDRINCEKWESQCFDCEQKKQYPKSFFLDSSRKNFELKKNLFAHVENMTIVTPSHWLADFVKDSFLREYPVEVIHNGIDTKVFSHRESDFRQKFALTDKKIVLGVASSWGKSKGLDDFIAMSKELSDDYRIVLVGVTEKQKQQLPPAIIAIERTNSAVELAEIYSAADVFVNPTYADNYPTVNLEAQSCGTPVITYRTGGSVESVPEEQVVEQGNVVQLMNCIYDVCEEGKFLIRDRSDFDCQRAFAQYIQLYKSKI